MEKDPWNSLEVIKLCASLFMPVVLAIFGIYIHRVTKKFENIQWRSQRLIEKRLAIYDALAPLFNDMLCYFTYVGCWRDLDPPTIISKKREIDKNIYLAAPLFSSQFFTECMNFQKLCFETFTGWGRDALLRTDFQRRQEARPNDWKSDWDNCFTSNVTDPKKIQKAYERIMQVFAQDIGVYEEFVIPPSGKVPINIK